MVRELRQHLDHLPRCRPLHAVLLDTQHRHEEDMHQLVNGHGSQPWIDNGGGVVSAAAGDPLGPLDYVNSVAEASHRASPRDELK
ncbi:hypothetical protein B296_00000699 [Ensete ventricosum]|uniref:Uncharacterized protein n=1 Tax=Ensete ventricosum TaxID=4639 RepID=A0A427B9T9_ENSVE|nr:hypothetical protein B296_00000699 [Ensete ventricosum]